jgi:hypothetical protein
MEESLGIIHEVSHHQGIFLVSAFAAADLLGFAAGFGTHAVFLATFVCGHRRPLNTLEFATAVMQMQGHPGSRVPISKHQQYDKKPLHECHKIIIRILVIEMIIIIINGIP